MPKKNHIVKESNTIARAQLMPESSSLWDERIIAAIAARNNKNDLEFKEQIIDIKELSTADGLSTSQYHEIDKAITRLVRSYFKVTMTNGDYTNYPVFAKIGLKGDSVFGKFNPELGEHYLKLNEQFAMRSLPEFHALSSTYSQKLYRFLNTWHKTNPEITVELEELNKILQTPESLRKNFYDFRRRVLEVAHREINAVAVQSHSNKPLEFDWEPVKHGKQKVVAVRFIFNVHDRRVAAKVGEVLEAIRAGEKISATV